MADADRDRASVTEHKSSTVLRGELHDGGLALDHLPLHEVSPRRMRLPVVTGAGGVTIPLINVFHTCPLIAPITR